MVSDLAGDIRRTKDLVRNIATPDTQAKAVEVKTFSINFLKSKTTKVTSTSEVDWTLVNVSGQVPKSAVGAILEVWLKTLTDNGIIQAFVRKEDTAIELEVGYCEGQAASDLSANMNQVWVGLTGARTFDYKLTDSTGSGGPDNFEIRVTGYW